MTNLPGGRQACPVPIEIGRIAAGYYHKGTACPGLAPGKTQRSKEEISVRLCVPDCSRYESGRAVRQVGASVARSSANPPVGRQECHALIIYDCFSVTFNQAPHPAQPAGPSPVGRFQVPRHRRASGNAEDRSPAPLPQACQ